MSLFLYSTDFTNTPSIVCFLVIKPKMNYLTHSSRLMQFANLQTAQTGSACRTNLSVSDEHEITRTYDVSNYFYFF